ncbi:MAG: NUDIX hydrolase [Lachnospiraceae bacterium]|nr:NUDIX hydrolase [Lachnospiraceae bacterium]MBQ3664717.1 NUDIX hydrolase [Lachnospiraceae bacterium]
MKWIGIKKKEQGKFITRYDVTYETEDGNSKVYEMISRNPYISSLTELQGKVADAVVIIAYNEEKNKILLNKEFRMAAGDFVYNFPAGMIEEGETIEQAAARELKEETGLELYEIFDSMNTSYSAVGFSNETNVSVVGKARGDFGKSTSVTEEICASWYTKEEVKELLKKEKFAARTQMFCYMWVKEM